MMRLDDWRSRLTVYLQGRVSMRFKPGSNDCATFAAGAVEAMTGVDLGRDYRGYRTLSGGKRRLRESGYDDHIALAASLLEEVPVAFATEGDIAVVQEADGEPALGVVQGEMIYVLRPDEGWGFVPLLHALRAFRV